jgi:hypothetical protein
MAVAVGDMFLRANWTLDDTEILLLLSGDNYKFTHFLKYESRIKEHIDLMKKAKEKAKKGVW